MFGLVWFLIRLPWLLMRAAYGFVKWSSVSWGRRAFAAMVVALVIIRGLSLAQSTTSCACSNADYNAGNCTCEAAAAWYRLGFFASNPTPNCNLFAATPDWSALDGCFGNPCGDCIVFYNGGVTGTVVRDSCIAPCTCQNGNNAFQNGYRNDGCQPPPGPCNAAGGDADGDGCCANNDYDDNDPGTCCPAGCVPGPCGCGTTDVDGDGCCPQTMQCTGDPIVGTQDCNDYDSSRCEDCDPEPCVDGDGDGCCVENDEDDTDPDICSPGPCDGRMGDQDEDGCCDDVDQDAGDPDVCEPDPCRNDGGDEDRDGCCDNRDSDPEDGEVGCECEDKGGDSDQDGCCDDEDCDPEDRTKCEKEDCCECNVNPMQKLQKLKGKLFNWWPDAEGLVSAASGQSVISDNGAGIWRFEGEITFMPGDDAETIPYVLSLDPEDWREGLGDRFVDSIIAIIEWARTYLLGLLLVTFAVNIIKLGELI